MNGSSAFRAIQRQGLHLGTFPALAAAVGPGTRVVLDHDLEILPELGREQTAASLADAVADLSARLAAAGVGPDEHVAIYKHANADTWMLACAVSRLGSVPVMLSPSLTAPVVKELLGRLDRPTLVADPGRAASLSSAPPDLVRQLITTTGDGLRSLTNLDGAPRVAPVTRSIDADAVVTHTSGTTGVPKLVVHTARTQALRLKPQWRLLSLLRNRSSVAIHVPFVHSRFVAAMALALLREMPVLLLKQSDPEDVARALIDFRPQLVEALPNSLVAWEGLTEDRRKPFSSVKYFSSTFDAIHPGTVNRLLRASDHPHPVFFQIYGQSEVGPAAGRPYLKLSRDTFNGRCVGWPMPFGCARVRVVSRDGGRPSHDNPGSIEVSWPALAKTYHGDDALYASNRDGSWWRTGDVGYRTRWGCLHLIDREVDMIPGTPSCLEIEDELLRQLDELSELVIVRGHHDRPVPVFTTTNDRPLEPGRWRTAAAAVPGLAEPVHLMEADLPRTGTLKVQRGLLARRLTDSAGTVSSLRPGQGFAGDAA